MRLSDLEGLGSRMDLGAPNRNRTGTPAMNEATDFKSGVSTSFTTGAEVLLCLVNLPFWHQAGCKFSIAMANSARTTT
jgi:hypothetical protein